MEHSKLIRVGILEDDPVVRAYLEKIIADSSEFLCVVSADSIADAKRNIALEPVDICLVDLQLPDGNGQDFTSLLVSTTKTKVLIITILGDRTSVLSALRAGAHGYLLKDATPQQIHSGLREVMTGANPISPQAATFLLESFRRGAISEVVDSTETEIELTKREEDVLTLFAKGLSYKETAASLGISQQTIPGYVKSIYSKLGVNSRNEAVYEAAKSGLIDY